MKSNNIQINNSDNMPSSNVERFAAKRSNERSAGNERRFGAKSAVVAVTRFVPGMIMSALTQYRMFIDLGFTPYLLVEPKLRSMMEGIDDWNIVNKLEDLDEINPALIIVNNVGIESLRLIYRCKMYGSKTFYVLHEPFPGLRRIAIEGPSRWIRCVGAYTLSALLCRATDVVLLPSNMAVTYYKESMVKINRSYRQVPLFFSDPPDIDVNTKRSYFSYIGTYCDAHAADDFLEFVLYAVEREQDIKFQIITRSSIADRMKDWRLQKLIEEKRLRVMEGSPLSEQEMSDAYLRSICCWAAYRDSTQSGVVVSALQHGAPLVATKIGSMLECGEAAEYVSSPTAFDEILNSYRSIRSNLCSRIECSRTIYERQYDYKSHLAMLSDVFSLDQAADSSAATSK